MTTIDVPVVLRDLLARLRRHARQPYYEIIEDALDYWLDAARKATPRNEPPTWL